MNHAILGRGQVGKAISNNIINGAISLYDKLEWEHIKSFDNIDVLHICIPYSDAMVDTINKAAAQFNPTVLIIHSSVRHGTTDSISFVRKLYSPVNGRHGDGFTENIRKYKKLFAGSKEAFNIVDKEFLFDTEYVGENTEQLEFAKLMCTSYTYWGLIYQHELYDECKKRGYDFELVYNKWNDYYNTGISNIHFDWRRPIYEYQEGLPKGHCLRPNIHLDNNTINDYLIKYEKEKQK